jgi:probable F420-dependent oxidoreductase
MADPTTHDDPRPIAAGRRPFQFMFGIRGIVDRAALIEQARIAEATGYTHICIHDHLTPQMAAIPVLTAVAMATERLRLCPLVLNNDLRHPAVLAQELATLDVISGGRLDIGIGAGWNEAEYAATGLRYDRPGVRIERMRESIAILRGLFGEGPFSHAGKHYTISGLDGQPKPRQRPHPPFLIGGTREHVVRVAAREADIVGLDLRQDRDALPDAFPARMDIRAGWIRDEAGARFGQLDINVLRALGEITVTDEPLRAATELAGRHAGRTGIEIDPEDMLESPYSLIGTRSSLVDKLRRGRERWGVNSVLIAWSDDPGLADIAPVIEELSGT